MKKTVIRCVHNSRTVFFAAEELKKYIGMIDTDNRNVEISYKDGNGGIKLGLLNDFELNEPLPFSDSEDYIYIEYTDGNGIISSNTERGILIAVYQFLREQGCRWLFPGKDGEFIPQKALENVHYKKKAYINCRAAATEGAASRENVLDFIDFAPKIGLNSYMTEFDTSYIYHEQFYRRETNKYKLNEDITNEIALSWKMEFRSELSKRSLLYHDMGHGWTAEPFGFHMMCGEDGIFEDRGGIPEEIKGYLALINGKRDLFSGFAINTNLCMSNPIVRQKVTCCVADYAEKNADVDFLHVWLADACNNHCECAECAKKTPADWYVLILNEIDEELMKRKLNTKIAFILYQELFWPPETERIKNETRFIMLFAPISRQYLDSYGAHVPDDGFKPFILNNISRPKTMGENLAYLKKWRKVFNGEAYTFEYHFHWLHYRDFGGFNVAKCVYDDVHSLKNASLNGIIENMTLRCAFPTALPVYVWARSMYDGSLSLDEIEKDYYKTAFGEDWKSAFDYYSKISELFDFKYMTLIGRRNDEPFRNDSIPPKMTEVIRITKPMKKIAETHVKNTPRCVSVSWQNMRRFCDFITYVAKSFEYLSSGNQKEAEERFNMSVDYIAKYEDELQKYMDLFAYTFLNKGLFKFKDQKDTLK